MITLSKIAKEAHVSVSTASKAFSGSTEVNEETRQVIFNVAKKYGCFKKFFNAKYTKYVIAVICPEFGSMHYARYLSFLRQHLEKENCEICVAESNFSAEKEKQLLEYYYKHADVDAIIVIQPAGDIYGYHEVPVLLLGRVDKKRDCPTVFCNMDTALEESIDYLSERGVDSVGYIGEALSAGKLVHLQNILIKKGLACRDEHIQIASQRFEAGGYEAMEKLLHASSLPRVVICAYDNMALGAMRCIMDHGLRIPEDIAILGMDNIPQAPYFVPPLASIASQTEELCSIATQTIIALINGKDVPAEQIVPSKLYIRKSLEIK